MRPVESPSCAGSFCYGSFLLAGIGWPGLCRIPELMIAAVFQKRGCIGRKFRGRFAELRNDTRIVENGVPVEIGPEDFQERSAIPGRAAALRNPIDGAGKRSAQRRPKRWTKHATRLSDGVRQLQ